MKSRKGANLVMYQYVRAAVVVRCKTRSPNQPCPELVTSVVGERDWFILHAHRGFGGSGKRAIEPESVSVSA